MPATINITNEQRAYFAGFIDADGHISLSFNNIRTGKPQQIYLKIGATNRNKDILQLLQSFYGGSIYKLKRPADTKWQDTYRWEVACQKAYAFLDDIYVHLIVKKSQAELALKFRETFTEHKLYRGMPEERVILKDQMHKLNFRGKE